MNVTLLVSGKKQTYVAECARLIPGGMQLRLAGNLPPVLVPIRACLKGSYAGFEFVCEVVGHVSAHDAAAWGMEAGCVVQFLDPSPGLLEAISRTLKGGSSPDTSVALDPELQRLLRVDWSMGDEDYYQLLGLRPDVELSAARLRCRDCRAKLDEVRTLALSAADRALVQPAIERVNQAMSVLGDPVARAEYDAARKNFHGVARCIQAGLTVADLESCRQRHLKRVPHAAKVAASYVEAAQALEARGERREALSNFERALALDPLDLKLHLNYARSRRNRGGGTRESPAA